MEKLDYHKVMAKKDLYLDGTDKKLFTKGRSYQVTPTTDFYTDGNIKDDNGYRHSINNSFINEYFKVVE